MLSYLTEGFVLGISLGATCLVVCGPVIFAFLLRQKRTLTGSFYVFAQILLGRFFGYAMFGIIAGAIGGIIPNGIRIPISFGSYIVLGGILVYYGLRGGHLSEVKCPAHSAERYIAHPVILGFLTGIEICPPFLLAVVRAANSGGAFGGMTLFIGFFAGTSLFLIPIAFFGVASSLKAFRIFGAIASVIIGVWFFAQGASGIVLHYISSERATDFSIVGVPTAEQIWIFSDEQWGDSLAAQLSQKTDGKISTELTANVDSILSLADTLDIAIWLAKSEPPETLYKRLGTIVFENDINEQSLLQFSEFLSIYHFKRKFGRGFLFRWRSNGS